MQSKEYLDIQQEWINVKELGDKEWILCYPSFEERGIHERKEQLISLGVEKLRFSGSTKLLGLNILGKGKNSIVIEGYFKGRIVAVKILRSDSVRTDMYWEAKMTDIANSVGVGPRLLGVEKDIILLERVYGKNLTEFLEQANEDDFREMLSELLKQAHRLDKISLRHKELSNAGRHVIINLNRPTIIDFESSTFSNKGHNVAALLQYILIRKRKGLLAKSELISYIRDYKNNPSNEEFQKLMNKLGLL